MTGIKSGTIYLISKTMLAPKITSQLTNKAENSYQTNQAQNPEVIQPTPRPVTPTLIDYLLAFPAIIVAATPLILEMMKKDKDKDKDKED